MKKYSLMIILGVLLLGMVGRAQENAKKREAIITPNEGAGGTAAPTPTNTPTATPTSGEISSIPTAIPNEFNVEECLGSIAAAKEIKIYMHPATMHENGKTIITSGECCYRTQDEEEIKRIVSMFDTWNVKANKVGENEIWDLLCPVFMTFDDKVVIGYPEYAEDSEVIVNSLGNHYGYIEDRIFYLPAGVGEYIRTHTSDSLTQK